MVRARHEGSNGARGNRRLLDEICKLKEVETQYLGLKSEGEGQ